MAMEHATQLALDDKRTTTSASEGLASLESQLLEPGG